MKLIIVYDVRTSYSESKLEYRIVDDDAPVARMFATSERAWFGEVIEPDAPGEAACEPGYALVIAHGDRGRPEERPRPVPITVTELYDASSVAVEAAKVAPTSTVIAMRVRSRKPAAEPAWPPEARPLHAESLAQPDDDAPRLVFADALAGKRGSLVIVQCDLARGGLTPAESRARRRAQRDLLAKHGAAWSRLGTLAKDCRFRRGFVEAATLSSDVLINDHNRLFDAAPHLASIALQGAPSGYVRELARACVRDGWWPRVRGLAIDAGALPHNFDGMLGDLRALELVRATEKHVRAIAQSGGVHDLDALWLPSHHVGADALGALVETSPNLRVLDVASTFRASMPIPPSIRELYATQDTGPLPRALEKLALYGPFDARVLEGLPSLHSLDLSAAPTPDRLEELPLPALRELRLGAVSPQQAAAIAAAFGEQLEQLDLRGVAGLEPVLDELRERVYGEVWIGKPDLRRPLIVAGYFPDEPMWDAGSVDLSG